MWRLTTGWTRSRFRVPGDARPVSQTAQNTRRYIFRFIFQQTSVNPVRVQYERPRIFIQFNAYCVNSAPVEEPIAESSHQSRTRHDREWLCEGRLHLFDSIDMTMLYLGHIMHRHSTRQSNSPPRAGPIMSC